MKILIFGDLAPTSDSNPYFKEKNTDMLFGDVRELFLRNDECLVNVECVVSSEEHTPIKKKGPNLIGDAGTADVMRELGVTLACLSNNHTFDFGRSGIAATMRELDRVGIAYTGYEKNYEDSRKNYILTKNNERVAVVNVCEHEYSYALPDRMGARPYDFYDTYMDIKNAKSSCDRVVVIYHGGKEQCLYPSDRLKKAFHLMAEAGADVVVGQHSHCIGCYENYNGAHLLYGQGNFHFVKVGKDGFATGEKWNSCMALEYDTETNTVNFTPVYADGVTLKTAKGERYEKMMRDFNERNAHPELWHEGWLEFVESVREMYTRAINRSFVDGAPEADLEYFPHYIDCEAHLDVISELFRTFNNTNEKN